jgi:hypothetical protein
MKTSIRYIVLIVALGLGAGLFFWERPQPVATSDASDNTELRPRVSGKKNEQIPNGTQKVFAPKGSGLVHQFNEWTEAKQISVDFLNPPEIDKDGLFCVINPEYQFTNRKVRENVEDGIWYSKALSGARGAILIGKGNGRPPWSYKIGELFIENDELQLRHRISFGGNKGVRTRLLLDLHELSQLTKIGIACDEIVPGSPWGYPTVNFDDAVITPDEVERIPLAAVKSNWVHVDINFSPVEAFHEPVRVIWLQFQDEGKRIVRIDN